MPLITIYCTPDWLPAANLEDDTTRQTLTAMLGEAFPKLVVDNCDQLHLRPEDTPEVGVQVDYIGFHRRGVNLVNLGIKVEFAEDPPPKHTQVEIRDALEDIVTIWFAEVAEAFLPPTLSCDAFWGPDKGFLIDSTVDREAPEVIRW